MKEHVNTGIKFVNKQYYQKLKHDYNEDKLGDLILLLSNVKQRYIYFSHARSHFGKIQYNNLKDDILWDLCKVVEDMVNRRLKLSWLKKSLASIENSISAYLDQTRILSKVS